MNTSLQRLALGLVVIGASVSGWVVYSNADQIAFDYISPTQVGAYRAQEYQLLDFRTPTEQEEGTITSTAFTINITASSVEDELASLNPERGYIIYDRNGKQLDAIVRSMHTLDFRDVKILEGGYQAWAAYTGQ